MVCSEGLLRRNIKVPSEALNPVQQGAAASKNSLTGGGQVSPGLEGGECPFVATTSNGPQLRHEDNQSSP